MTRTALSGTRPTVSSTCSGSRTSPCPTLPAAATGPSVAGQCGGTLCPATSATGHMSPWRYGTTNGSTSPQCTPGPRESTQQLFCPSQTTRLPRSPFTCPGRRCFYVPIAARSWTPRRSSSTPGSATAHTRAARKVGGSRSPRRCPPTAPTRSLRSGSSARPEPVHSSPSPLPVGETVILMTPLFIHIETPTKGRGGAAEWQSRRRLTSPPFPRVSFEWHPCPGAQGAKRATTPSSSGTSH